MLVYFLIPEKSGHLTIRDTLGLSDILIREIPLYAHTCRYLVFFSPLDVCVYLCSATPVQLALHTVEEVGRAKKILSGVTMASTLYPHSILAMAIVGMLKGSHVHRHTHIEITKQLSQGSKKKGLFQLRWDSNPQHSWSL